MALQAVDGAAEKVTISRALVGIPRLSREQWAATGIVARWLIVSRASVLVMTFSSVALGGLLALIAGAFDPAPWSLCLVGSLLAHATNNQLNDLTDSMRGIDAGNSFRRQYGVHALEDGLLERNGLWMYIVTTGAGALLFGLLVAWLTGPSVLIPMVIGGVLLVFYTYPLKQLGLGEIAVLCVWGPLMVGGTYLAVTGSWSWHVAIIATVCALGPTAVILGKHIDKIDFDRARDLRTLPVRLGSAVSRGAVVVMTVLQFVAVVALVMGGLLPWPALTVAFALPAAVRLVDVYRREPPARPPTGYPTGVWPLWYTAIAFVHARNFGLLILLGLLAAWGMSSVGVGFVG